MLHDSDKTASDKTGAIQATPTRLFFYLLLKTLIA